MPNPLDPRKKEQPSTYFVQDQHHKEELARLTTQDHLITASMGGVLPEQPDPAVFRRVLDVGCGSGGWAIEAAKAYPAMSLIGIDISKSMIDYARAQAAAAQVTDRVEFHMMDALRVLEFPADFFDLVNLRFGFSFLRTWDWLKLLGELLRITRPGVLFGSRKRRFSTRAPVLRSCSFKRWLCVAFFRQDISLLEKVLG